MSDTKPEALTDAVTAMNALPDISHDDSERLKGFMRMTAAEIKAVGGVGAATSLGMIGYIRELEMKLSERSETMETNNDLKCSCCGKTECDCGPYIERGSKTIDDPCRICGKCINHCPHQ